MEELEDTRQGLRRSEQRLRVMAQIVNDDLLKSPRADTLADRGYRWFARRRVRRTDEWQVAQQVESSDLFDGIWYLEHYPKAAASGMPPALHYVRHGAKQGYDPGPAFSSSGYLAAHPRVAASNANPLVHYLRSKDKSKKGKPGGSKR
jgi:hypothetical protein